MARRRAVHAVLIVALSLLIGAAGYLTLRYRQMSRFAGPWHADAAVPHAPAFNRYVLELWPSGSYWHGTGTDFQITSGLGANVGRGRWGLSGDRIVCEGWEFKIEQHQGETVLTRRQVLNDQEIELVYRRGWGPLETHWRKELTRVGRDSGS